MSLHIGAQRGEIAETVLISGDPLRARHIANSMLTEVTCYNEVRGMLGFTGLYNGKLVSVQGTGMGIPSTAIYVHELIHDYGVQNIIRVGTCGAVQADLPLGTIILATEAYTDSSTHAIYAPAADPSTPDPHLLHQVREVARDLGIATREGMVFSSDLFYHPDTARWEPWIQKGLLAIEMETSILYDLGRQYGIRTLSVLSVSDNLITHAYTSAAERQHAGEKVMKLALGTA